jgi:uncharacterized protein (TIGR00369 family)
VGGGPRARLIQEALAVDLEDRDMDLGKAIEQGFRSAPFVAHLGIELDALGPGWCEARLDVQPWHLQQTGVVHAGVVATLAQLCAGGVTTTQIAPGEFVVTAEYKINLLRGARGARLHCRAEVLKPGQMLTVVEASVYAERDGRRELVAKLNATMAIVRP